MPSLSLVNLSKPEKPALKVRLCSTFWTRFRGLMLTPALDPYGGILIDEQNDSRMNASIHMFFMNYDIAVVWINSQFKVVDRILARRWKPFYAPRNPARYILEVHADRLMDFNPGDRVQWGP